MSTAMSTLPSSCGALRLSQRVRMMLMCYRASWWIVRCFSWTLHSELRSVA
jgi:hypothetical protein